MGNGDVFFVALFLLLILGWMGLKLKRWLYAPRKTRMALPFEWEDPLPAPRGEAVTLLENEGYEVVSGKVKAGIRMKVSPNVTASSIDDQNIAKLESRLFFDYIVTKENEWFVVKIARDRQPVNWTGSGIRDKLMLYAMLFDGISGVVYVDLKQRQVIRIDFAIALEGGNDESAQTS